MDPRIAEIRAVLDALARVENADNDTKEIVYDEQLAKIKSLDHDNIIIVVNRAIGANKRRKRYSPFVFSELHEVPGIDRVFIDLLESADDFGRSDIIQTIGRRRMRNLVGVLNEHFYQETDSFCKDMTLHALAKIADESSLPIFIELMELDDPKYRWRVLVAALHFARPEFRDYLERVFEETTESADKIMAAWGLAKLNHIEPYKYLVSMLDDPQVTRKESSATTYGPGQSIRAAQAIADINGWEFEWGRSSVDKIKKRVASGK